MGKRYKRYMRRNLKVAATSGAMFMYAQLIKEKVAPDVDETMWRLYRNMGIILIGSTVRFTLWRRDRKAAVAA